MGFDEHANTWDDLPRRVELAKSVVKHSLKYLNPEFRVLEFGCGTGLVGLNLFPYIKELTGIDTSEKMVEKFNEKAKRFNLNAKGYVKDIFETDETFDLAISSMTIHHIKDIGNLSKKLSKITKRAIIADLVKEDGSFHTRGNEGVWHFGFDKEELKEAFKDWKMEYKIIHTVKKHKDFPIFLAYLER